MPSLYIGEQPVRTVALASNNDDATAVAADVMKDKIAYNQYGKIVGTAEPAEDLDSEMTAQDSLIEQIKSAVATKSAATIKGYSNIEFIYANSFKGEVSITIDNSCSYIGFSDGGSNCYSYMKLEKGSITQQNTLGSTNYTVRFNVNGTTLTASCVSSTYTGYAVLAKLS